LGGGRWGWGGGGSRLSRLTKPRHTQPCQVGSLTPPSCSSCLPSFSPHRRLHCVRRNPCWPGGLLGAHNDLGEDDVVGPVVTRIRAGSARVVTMPTTSTSSARGSTADGQPPLAGPGRRTASAAATGPRSLNSQSSRPPARVSQVRVFAASLARAPRVHVPCATTTSLPHVLTPHAHTCAPPLRLFALTRNHPEHRSATVVFVDDAIVVNVAW
jgi:hypothetical protein